MYGAVYSTRHYNVWANSETTSALYNELSQKASPHLKSVRAKIPLEVNNTTATTALILKLL